MGVFLILREIGPGRLQQSAQGIIICLVQPRLMIGLIIVFFEFEGCLCLMEADVGRDAEGPAMVKAWKGKLGEGQCSPKRKAAFLQHWH